MRCSARDGEGSEEVVQRWSRWRHNHVLTQSTRPPRPPRPPPHALHIVSRADVMPFITSSAFCTKRKGDQIIVVVVVVRIVVVVVVVVIVVITLS